MGVAAYAQKPPEWALSEKLICHIDTSAWEKESLKVSPDSKRLAYAARTGNKWFVVVDGKEEKQYDGLGAPLFSPDSTHVAYAAQMDNKQCVVVDGKEEKQYDGIKAGTLLFSPDSKRLAYAARTGNKWFVVVDGKEEKQYDGILITPLFSPDSAHVVYAAQMDNKQCVVVDGKEEKQYDGLGALLFSPDSKRVAYAALSGNKWLVVVDGKEEKQYDGLGALLFSPDSKRVAYAALSGSKCFVVVDGKEEKQYDGIGAGMPLFSPDSTRVAYPARIDNKWLVVVDGKQEKQYDDIGAGMPLFSPDSTRVAYPARIDNKWLVVVDGKEEKQYDDIMAGTPLFSPDSKRVAYAALSGSKWLVVADGKEEKQYDGIGAGAPLFSPDSTRVAYPARIGSNWFMVVDGKEEKQYDGIRGDTLLFSPDSTHMAYAAQMGNKWFVVVDGKEEKQYDGIVTLGGGKILFDSADSLHYLALKGSSIYLLEERTTRERKYSEMLHPLPLGASGGPMKVEFQQADIEAVAGKVEVAAQAITDDRYPKHSVVFPGGVTSFPDLTYATPSGYRPLTLDLYLPPNSLPAPAAGFPLVVHVHGGGWMAGHARHSGAFANFPNVLASLAAKGYVVASVNYRLSSEAKSPAAAIDIKTAIRWLRSKAADYRIDPARAATWGGSAGGQLAGLVAVTCGVHAFDPNLLTPVGAVDGEGRPISGSLPADVARQSDCVQAAVAWYGVFDFATLSKQAGAKEGQPTPATRAAYSYLGCGPIRCQPGLREGASSTTYVDAKDPPMLLVHGTADEVVPYQQSEEMAARLKEAGVRADLILIKGVGHSFIGSTNEQTREASLKALYATFDFFDKTIGANSGEAGSAR
jgi:acetyl esterase/lipase/Tol biopolymer transport system component